jgi:hypothetical protein
MWCKAKPNAAWKKVLSSGLVELSRRVSVVPLALANDGRSFFAEISTKTYSGVVRIDAASSRVAEIKRFNDPINDQAIGSFDGRWLVWTEYHSLYDSDDFTVWSWDSRSGRLRQIGAAQRAKKRGFLPSAWQAVVALDGYATWEQGSGPNNLGDVHVVNLRTGRDLVVRRGHVGGPFLAKGPLVIWPESMKSDALTIMRTVDIKTGRLVATPSALRHARGALVPVTDGEALAYTTNNWGSLWWSPSLKVKPRRVLSSRVGYPIDNSVQVVGHFVFFGIQPVSYFADAARGRFIKINEGGWARVGAKAYVFLKPSKKKALHGISDIIFLPLKSLPPIPPCK